MTAKRAARRQDQHESAEVPQTLIPPGDAEDKDKSAYWIDLLSDVAALKAATDTTDFFVLMQEFPAAAWDRLTIYLYRLTDDAGMLIKNSDDKPHYIKVLRQPLTEEFVAKNWGGGKYQALLKIDNKEVLRKHTFRIDGDPKVLPGQRVEIEGKLVPITGGQSTASEAQVDNRSDVATIIDANSKAEEKRMEMLLDANKASIELVREQASNAAKPDASAGLMDKLMTAMIERMMNPPAPAVVADPIDTFVKLQTLINKQNPEAPEPKDPPLEEAMTLVEKLTGRNFSDLVKGRNSPAAEPVSPWIAIAASVAEKFFAVAPALFQQANIAKNLEFQRQAWLRTAKPGEPIPAQLLALNEPAPAERKPPTSVDAEVVPDANANAMQLAAHIVQMVCHGFDTNPYNGGETAAAIAFQFGKQIEATGLDALLADPAQVGAMVEGNPLLKQRSTHSKWPQFQVEFMEYMGERFGEMAPETETSGPQPVA